MARNIRWTPPKPPSPAVAVAEFRAELEQLETARRQNPYINPVLQLSHAITNRISDGSLDYSSLADAIQNLSADGFATRTQRTRRYLGETDPASNKSELEQLFRRLAKAPDGSLESFSDFDKKLNRYCIGAVITAHPTFNLPPGLMTALAELAGNYSLDGERLDESGRDQRLDRARTEVHRPNAMTLEREHTLSLDVVANLSIALREIYGIALKVAADLYPDDWMRLRPRLLSVASWVGYDLDGRSDVGWMDTLLASLRGMQRRLKLLAEEFNAILAEANGAPQKITAALTVGAQQIDAALAETQEEVDAFAAAAIDPKSSPERIQKISRRIVGGGAERLANTEKLTALLDSVLPAATPALARRIAVLRTELDNSGLTMSGVHMRVNAAQLHNTVRSRTGLEGDPDDPRFRATLLSRIEALLDGVEQETINFGSILTEKASARRLLMVAAQILKHFDQRGHIRFLIAECETAFTPLVALYFARMFGIDDRIDISPLFETSRALRTGTRMLDTLLSNPHYRAYVERRGRICVQTGYSDAGRYLGQIPAAASIERFKFRLAGLLQKHGLTDIELVVFDTHGESVGRGAHPSDLIHALEYVDNPAQRCMFRNAGITVKEEISFQGGDGYLYFLTPTTALAAATRMLTHSLTPPEEIADPFHSEREGIRELFTVVSEFQRKLNADSNYGTLLGTFAPHFTYPSGSRALTRQQSGMTVRPVRYSSDLRAIPQNSALQQLGLLANSWGGVGAAVLRTQEQFARLYRESRRLRILLGIAEYAASAANFDAAQAYVEVMNPGLWLRQAAEGGDWKKSSEFCRIAELLEPGKLHDAQDRIVRMLHADYLAMIEGMRGVTSSNATSTERPPHLDTNARQGLAILHAIRVTIIHEIFRLAIRVPDFAPQLNTTRQETVLRLLRLDVPGAMAVLRKIYRDQPSPPPAAEDFGEPATYRGSEHRTYRKLHDEVFVPLEDLYDLLLRTGTAVTHYVGFFG